MFILNPVYHTTIWGGTKLYRYGKDCSDKIGHLYMVNGHQEMSTMLINGKYAGKTLYEVYPLIKNELKLCDYDEFPLTIALVDASQSLSIQVHPDDVIAEKLENQKIGKTESWLFLDEPVSGWIYAGCKCDTEKEIDNAIKNNEMESITDHLNVRKDDYVCIKAGTLHAMTAGSLVYEIEYGSDFTYRFYDYGRIDENGKERELHIEKAIMAIDTNVYPKVEKLQDNLWMCEEKYEICRIKDFTNYKNISYEMECISFIEGDGCADGCIIKDGMSIILKPDEKLEDINIKTAIIARLRK